MSLLLFLGLLAGSIIEFSGRFQVYDKKVNVKTWSQFILDDVDEAGWWLHQIQSVAFKFGRKQDV